MSLAQSQPSYPQKLAQLTKSTAGLDLILRLSQALTQIATELGIKGHRGVRCAIATTQLALARRYLRFFSFIELFQQVHQLSVGQNEHGSHTVKAMRMTESSLLGLYILMENLTMLHDMDIWLVPWYEPVLIEANKLWFYAICISLTRSIMQLSAKSGMTTKSKSNAGKRKNKKDTSSSDTALSRSALVKRLVVDSCDLTLPASCVGWLDVGNLGVGLAMVVSTVISLAEMWEVIN